MSTGNIRPYIPFSLRRKVFDSVHGLSHPSAKSTKKLLLQKFVWPNMNKDSKDWCRCCDSCQRSKITRHVKSPIQNFPEIKERFSVIHVDIIGPLPVSNNFTYALTCIDRFTRWMEVIPLTDIKAETVALAFYSGWISRFGVPKDVVTDKGKQFVSDLFTQMMKLFGIQLNHTTTYHPQSKGMIERFNKTLKQALKCRNSINWTMTLPSVLLGLRSTIHSNADVSVAEMVYGTTIRLTADLLDCSNSTIMNPNTTAEILRNQMQNFRPIPIQHAGTRNIFVHKDLSNSNQVMFEMNQCQKV